MSERRNLITDVPGILVGNAHDERVASGVTALLLESVSAVSCAILGGAPGSRETSLPEPDMIAPGDTIEGVYRVEAIAERSMTLTYLPLGQQQTLQLVE